MSAGIPAKLARVLDLDGRIPWDLTEFPGIQPAPRPIGLVLRSEMTVRQMLDAMPEPQRTRKLEECEVYGTPMDEPYEIGWTVHRPRPDSGFFARMTFSKWLAYEESKMPVGYVPVRLDAEEQRRRAFNSPGRDAAIRDALKTGASIATLKAETGLSRPRIYQIRDGK
jgi:hypothetical protein